MARTAKSRPCTDVEDLSDRWSWETAELLLALCNGLALKVVTVCYLKDRATIEPLKFPHCLWEGPEKFRSVASVMMVVQIAFFLPNDVFHTLMEKKWEGIPLGFWAILLIGYAADELFLLLHFIVGANMRRLFNYFQEKMDEKMNGHSKMDDDDDDFYKNYKKGPKK